MGCFTEQDVRVMDDWKLRSLRASGCYQCSFVAGVELARRGRNLSDVKLYAASVLNERARAKAAGEPGQYVNAKHKVRTPHDLSFLIREKSGENVPVVVKDVDSKTLHDMLDIADEVVISRVNVK